MTGRRAEPRPARRAVLAACGTGLAALAGCAAVDVGGRDRDADREYDATRLDAIADAGVPTPPETFPVEVTPMVDRHLTRARELLSAVPERPDVPNGEVARRLRHDREHVVEDLEGGARDGATGLERLARARRVRRDAAELDGAHRAATGAVDRETVDERRSGLRADRLSFEPGWTYRGDDPARALVVHAELEGLLEDARRDAEAWPPFPDDPGDDVFRVGEIFGSIEGGRAALVDAERIRTKYLEGATDPSSYREAFTVAAHELDRLVTVESRLALEYLGDEFRPGELPFDRSLEDTPALELYVEARRNADAARRRGDARRRAGDFATATLQEARSLASLRAFEAVVDAVERGEYGPPDDADSLASEREAAVAALEAAWETEPMPVSTEVAGPAHGALRLGVDTLERSDRWNEVDEALANFAYARAYAEAVSPAVGTVTDLLEDGG